MKVDQQPEDMGDYTSIRVTHDLADSLHELKDRGDSYEDVIWRLMEIPGEYRVDCGECGFDGGTYDFRADAAAPSFCPQCGREVEEHEAIHVVAGEDEPTSLSWKRGGRE